MLNCTWDEMEHEIAIRRLGGSLTEQQRAEQDYNKLREEFRKSNGVPASQNGVSKSE